LAKIAEVITLPTLAEIFSFRIFLTKRKPVMINTFSIFCQFLRKKLDFALNTNDVIISDYLNTSDLSSKRQFLSPKNSVNILKIIVTRIYLIYLGKVSYIFRRRIHAGRVPSKAVWSHCTIKHVNAYVQT
jgi:hypothetical protein